VSLSKIAMTLLRAASTILAGETMNQSSSE